MDDDRLSKQFRAALERELGPRRDVQPPTWSEESEELHNVVAEHVRKMVQKVEAEAELVALECAIAQEQTFAETGIYVELVAIGSTDPTVAAGFGCLWPRQAADTEPAWVGYLRARRMEN